MLPLKLINDNLLNLIQVFALYVHLITCFLAEGMNYLTGIKELIGFIYWSEVRCDL